MTKSAKAPVLALCVLVWQGPALAAPPSVLDADRRAYRLCLARAVTAVEDRFSPPASLVSAVKGYCQKEAAGLSVMARASFGGDPDKELTAAESWAASYVVAIRSCNSGACELLEAMQRDDLGL